MTSAHPKIGSRWVKRNKIRKVVSTGRHRTHGYKPAVWFDESARFELADKPPERKAILLKSWKAWEKEAHQLESE